MDIKEQLLIIAEICRQDQKLLASRANLQRLNLNSQEAKLSASKLESAISALLSSKAEALKHRKALDEKLQAEKSNLRKWESRAEKIKGEREYTALMSEISSQKRTITAIEAEMSEITNELKLSDEKLTKAHEAHKEKLERVNTAFLEVKELLSAEEESLSSYNSARDALLSKIPLTLQARYKRIYDNRAQQGVAFVKNEVCLSCQRKLPSDLYIRVCKMEVVEQCPSCQRLLVADMSINKD